jgi:hypothetical protein
MLTKESKLEVKEILRDEFQKILDHNEVNIKFIFSDDRYIDVINFFFSKNYKNEKGIKIKLEKGNTIFVFQIIGPIMNKLESNTFRIYEVTNKLN